MHKEFRFVWESSGRILIRNTLNDSGSTGELGNELALFRLVNRSAIRERRAARFHKYQNRSVELQRSIVAPAPKLHVGLDNQGKSEFRVTRRPSFQGAAGA
jgi:hypothetical protein